MMDLIMTYYCILSNEESPVFSLSFLTAMIILVTYRFLSSLSGKYLLGEIFRVPASLSLRSVSVQCVTPAGIRRPEICP